MNSPQNRQISNIENQSPNQISDEIDFKSRFLYQKYHINISVFFS